MLPGLRTTIALGQSKNWWPSTAQIETKLVYLQLSALWSMLFPSESPVSASNRAHRPRDLDRGEQLSREKGRGLGRLGNGTFTNYDRKAAEERAEAVKKNPNALCDHKREEGEDVCQA
jgi:hypothetical protein